MEPAEERAAAGAEPGNFTRAEFARRIDAVRHRMDARGLDALLLTGPESIYYLTGLDHQGFFAFHALVVPPSGELTLVTREMERVTAQAQLLDTRFVGFRDTTTPQSALVDVLAGLGLTAATIGLEKERLALSPAVYDALREALPAIDWQDASLLVDDLRLVKSDDEIAYTRRAARVSDAMMEAALAVARPGVNECTVAAEAYRAMAVAGGEYPAFAPFIRPSPRMGQEHTTWRDRELRSGEALFLEMAGCLARYHAPVGRFLHLGRAPRGSDYVQRVCHEAFERLVEVLRPGLRAAEAYDIWFRHVERAGILDYHRHHCGYVVGLAFPPSWTGGSSVVGLRHGSELVLEAGMVFHLMSWLLNTGQGDYFLSNTVLLSESGCEVLTRSPYRLESG